jgi:hypothetical protein
MRSTRRKLQENRGNYYFNIPVEFLRIHDIKNKDLLIVDVEGKYLVYRLFHSRVDEGIPGDVDARIIRKRKMQNNVVFHVSVPIKWIRSNFLKKGDVLVITYDAPDVMRIEPENIDVDSRKRDEFEKKHDELLESFNEVDGHLSMCCRLVMEYKPFQIGSYRIENEILRKWLVKLTIIEPEKIENVKSWMLSSKFKAWFDFLDLEEIFNYRSDTREAIFCIFRILDKVMMKASMMVSSIDEKMSEIKDNAESVSGDF